MRGGVKPLHDLIEAHVMAAARLHGDDTPVPVLANGRCATGRAWIYVPDDRPFGGADPPAALFRYSRDRSGAHPVDIALDRHLLVGVDRRRRVVHEAIAHQGGRGDPARHVLAGLEGDTRKIA